MIYAEVPLFVSLIEAIMGKIVRPDPEEWLIFHEEEAIPRLKKIIQRIRFLSISDPFFEKTKAMMAGSYDGDRVIIGDDWNGRLIKFQFEYDRGRIGLGPYFFLEEYCRQTLLNRQREFFKRYYWCSSSEFRDTVVPIDCQLIDLTAELLLDAFRRMFIQDIMQL